VARTRFRYRALEDFVTANELTVDAVMDDGWGASMSVKGREIDAAILFADISAFTERTADMSPVETLTYVNHFFTWITAEALNEGPGIIDKYIGDEVMVVFSDEFGSEDPFEDAVRAALRMAENDVMDFGPHIGISQGPVIVGYAGTPVRHNCSVFGAPVALAARCAGVPPPDDAYATHVITFPADDWGSRGIDDIAAPAQSRDPETGEVEQDDPASSRWNLTDPFTVPLKGRGDIALRQLHDQMMRINNFTVEDRTKKSVEYLERANRYWPDGRHPKSP
jgi:class 3 adenylate cyclase